MLTMKYSGMTTSTSWSSVPRVSGRPPGRFIRPRGSRSVESLGDLAWASGVVRAGDQLLAGIGDHAGSQFPVELQGLALGKLDVVEGDPLARLDRIPEDGPVQQADRHVVGIGGD